MHFEPTSLFFDPAPITERYGGLRKMKKKRDLLGPQTVVTIQLKIKSLKTSLIKKLQQGAYETNQVWNYCNEVSHKALKDKGLWLSHFDLTNLMTGDIKHSDDNPFGFQVINSANCGSVANEFITRRNQFGKAKLRFRKTLGTGKSLGWIPFKEEHINISYAYDYVQRKITEKEKLNKKTGAVVLETKIKEKTIQKHIRVAGKNTPEKNLHALYSLENDSGHLYGLPSHLGAPTIQIMGTHIKVFNDKYLSYYLYHLGAQVRSGTFSENALGEWFLNLAVSMDSDVYTNKHMFGKLKLDEVAPVEQLGLDFGSSMLCTASDGTEYSSENVYQEYEDKIKAAQQNNDLDQVKRLHLKVKNKREDNINKAGLDIMRKAQYIKAGDLNVMVIVKRKTFSLTPKDVKKHRSERRKKVGFEKQEEKNKFLEQQQKNKTKNIAADNINTSSNKENTSNKNSGIKATKKRKGFGKNLLDQGVGKLKSRLGSISQRTGRGYELVNERNTTQVCCNCDSFTGTRGLRQLGVREWICRVCGTQHKRDVCGAKNMLRTEHIGNLTRTTFLSGQASKAYSNQMVDKNKSKHHHKDICDDGSSLGGKSAV